MQYIHTNMIKTSQNIFSLIYTTNWGLDLDFRFITKTQMTIISTTVGRNPLEEME